MKPSALLALLILFPLSCLAQQRADGLLIYGGDILTMSGSKPGYVEAVMVRDDRIVYVGQLKEAERYADKSTRRLDLHGRALLPGFIDAHSHLLSYADTVDLADLHSPPVGSITSIPEMVSALQRYAAQRPQGSWIVGAGYDQDQFKEKRHPTAADLDQAFPDRPVVLVHVSGHMLVANSEAMRIAGINAASPDPAGGRIIRVDGSNRPAGLMQEGAMMPFGALALKPPALDIAIRNIQRALKDYAAAGITTANEGLLPEARLQLLQTAAARKALSLDVIALPAAAYAQKLLANPDFVWNKYVQGLKFGGVKVQVDGSPQGKTAFLTEAYLTPVPGCTSNCRGFSNLTQEQLNEIVLKAYQAKVKVFAHCNGDAAADMMLKAAGEAEKTLKNARAGEGTVIIHSQIIRPDQIRAYQKQGFIPSFFTNHTYFWGDVHLENLGAKRANFISPLKSAARAGILFTNHTDTPVTPMNQLFLVWSAVNRVSRTGKTIGEAEKVSPYLALKAITINGAFQYGEQKDKGTIELGKLADFVILDRNPLKVPEAEIKNIKVEETIKSGKTVFSAVSK